MSVEGQLIITGVPKQMNAQDLWIYMSIRFGPDFVSLKQKDARSFIAYFRDQESATAAKKLIPYFVVNGQALTAISV